MSGTGPLYFEGTEKKFELAVDSAGPSFRDRGIPFWSTVVQRADARILSRIGNERCDAFLLSESSLFVFDHKVLMITCGRTRLTGALTALLDTIPAEQVQFLAYERKNEVFPHNQASSFFDDIRLIHERLPGRAFKFGDEDDHHLYLFHLTRSFDGDPQDGTTELLMYGIDEAAREMFSSGGGREGAETVRRRAELDRILPDFEIDDHAFEPTGYSLNGIRDDQYWTLHVTPNALSSYVSFETNYRFNGDLEEITGRIIDIFRPRAFDFVRFDQADPIGFSTTGYRLKTRVEQRLECGYNVRFLNFYRPETGVRQPLELPVV